MKSLSHITLKPDQNYVAFFTTLACNLRCPYCINWHEQDKRLEKMKRDQMGVDDWIKAADRLVLRADLPLTLQGGEPTLWKGFYRFVNEVKPDLKMDLLTNMSFDADEFIKRVPRARFTREAPYAAIRVSYHPGQNTIDDLIRKAKTLEAAGFRVGIYGVMHPSQEQHIIEVQKKCREIGIDFRTKEFLGEYQGRLYGTFKYADAVCGKDMRYCMCKTSEIIVDPTGSVYRCHADLYKARDPIAHILDADFNEEAVDRYRVCYYFGDCNPCDVKVKTNRFQIYGHTSVEIKEIKSVKGSQCQSTKSIRR